MVKNKFIKLGEQKIASIKQHNEQILQNNKQKAFSIPEYKKLVHNQNKIIIQISKNEFDGIACQDLYDELNKLNNMGNEILEKINLNQNDLKYIPTCNKCLDTGYVDGKMCECLKKAAFDEMKQSSGVSFYNDVSLCDIINNPLKNNDQQILLAKKLQEIIKTRKSSFVLSILGECGVGKTYVTSALANDLINDGNYVFISSAFSLDNDMLKYHTTFDNSKQGILSPYLECDYLFIDDLGVEPIYNNVTLEYLYLILSERNKNHKSTIITSNLTLEQIINVYSARIFSRIADKKFSILFNLSGTDLRINGGNNERN